MRRTCCVALLLANLFVSLLLGCGQQNGGGGNNHAAQPQPVVAPAVNLKGADPRQGTPAPQPGDPVDVWKDMNFTPPDANQEKYDAAMMDAIDLLAQKKYTDALASMEAASKFKDTELVQTEMKKLRLRIDQQQAADSTLHDIQTLFDQGQFAEAGLLATEALKEYGSTDSAPELVKLKLQADALTVSGQADNNAKHKSFRDQGQTALGTGNFRAAVLAFEQALQFADDAGLRKTCDDLRAKLAKYDDNRARAAELRKNAVNLEEALKLLQDAATEWDTPQIKQDIDEYTLALQNRRDRIAIADFEIRGDIGIPMADRVIAEELLPYFKGRFDIVERGQFAKVLDELKLEGGKFGTDQDRQEFGKLAKVRYLVLGSVSRVGGVSVNARLVDVQTGLVVQTAKITAASPDDLLAHLPDLAKLLLMSDQEQFAYQADLAKQAPPLPPLQVDQPLPPPPELPGPGQPVPPPEILDTKLPPNFGGAKPADIGGFQPLPEGQPLPPIVYGGEPEEVWKRKALYVSVYMGDTLYRRGRPAAALRYFDFGLTLAPGFLEIDFRITKLRPLLPPPPVIIVVPPPPPPRIAIIDFVVVGDPLVVDPGLSWWTARAMAPYFSPPYEVVDPGEVYWWMARMGMTVRDLMVDPYARRWLGRALNVRYFVFGVITPTASFNVDTSMVDAEYGYLQGRGFVHVNNSFELRYRVGELARMTQSAPGLLPQQQKVFVSYEGLIGKARLAANRGELKIAINLLGEALVLRPGSIEVLVYLERLQKLDSQRTLEAQRRKDFEFQQKLALEQKLRQEELARQAEGQRILAVQAAAMLSKEQRDLREKERLAAQLAGYNQLLGQARIAFKANNFTVSIQIYESAAKLRPNDDVYRELASARAELERVTKLRKIEEDRLRDLKFQQAKAAELVQANARLEAERKKRAADDAALKKAEQLRDETEYLRLVDQGQKQMAKAQFNPAISTFQAAKRLKKTDAVDALLTQATLGQVAESKGAAARQELEKQLANEKALRAKADAEAKVNQDKYQALLKNGQKALAGKDYNTAITNFNEAGRIFKTDAVLTGLKQAETARDQAVAAAQADKDKQLAEKNKLTTFQALMTEGQTALAGKDYTKAVDKFAAARKLFPANLDASAALTKAQQAQSQAGLDAQKKLQDDQRINTFKRLLQDSHDNFVAKQYDAAVASLTEALKLNPGDPFALSALKTAQAAQASVIKGADQAAEAKKKADAYQKLMTDGRLALQGKQFDAAIGAFTQAQTIMPGDMASKNFLKDAQDQKKAVRDGEIAAAKKTADDLQRKQDLQKALIDGRSALAAKNLAAAEKSLAIAIKLAPTDPGVTQFQADLQKARAAVQADADVQKKRKTQFDALMTNGKKSLDAKQFDAAIKALTDANALLPGDKTNADLLKLAYQQQAATKAASDAAAKKAAGDTAAKVAAYNQAIKQGQSFMAAKQYDEAIKQFQLAGTYQPGDKTAAALIQQAEQLRNAGAADMQKIAEFNRLMKEGSTFLAAKKYAEAVNSFGAAQKLMPGDQNAAKALQSATQQWNASKAPAGPTPAQIAEYNKQMQLGASLDKQKKYDESVKAYNAALVQIPKDNKATYSLHMAEGNRHMTAKRFPDAVIQFEAALRVIPNDPEATAALKKAKAGK